MKDRRSILPRKPAKRLFTGLAGSPLAHIKKNKVKPVLDGRQSLTIVTRIAREDSTLQSIKADLETLQEYAHGKSLTHSAPPVGSNNGYRPAKVHQAEACDVFQDLWVENYDPAEPGIRIGLLPGESLATTGDRRLGRPSPKRVPVQTVERMLK